MLRFVHIRPANPELTVHDGRVVEENVLLTFTCSVFTNELEGPAGQFFSELARVCNRCRSADELRLASVKFANPGKPPEEVRHVASENASIRVQFVQYDEFQVLEQPGPLRMMRQNPLVKHVRIAEDDFASRSHGRPRILRRVAVIRVDACLFVRAQSVRPLHEVVELIVGQGLRRIEVQCPRFRVLQDPREHRQVVAQRLPRSRRRNDRNVPAVSRQLERLSLMGIQLVYTPRVENLLQARIERGWKVNKLRFARRNAVIAGNGIALLELTEEFTKAGRFFYRRVSQQQRGL